MNAPYKAVKVAGNVYWVGAIDWNLRDFHGYSTNEGTTYNAYLVTGKKPVLIDTVKAPFYDEMISRISSVINPADIKIIISNHSEMDHSGSLPRFIKEFEPEKVIASRLGKQALELHFGTDLEITPVKEGESLVFGENKFTFIEAGMLHWPDSMVTYMQNRKILFSNDIFAMHMASGKRFDDETQNWYYQAAKYYANIVMPYSLLVLKFAKKINELGIAPKIIAPDHGPIWRSDCKTIINLYIKWARREIINKAVIAYDTMWESTAKLANAIAQGLIQNGTETKVMSLKVHHRSDVVTELLDAASFIVGAPTMNGQIYPTLADLLTYIKGLKPKGLTGQVFGSYGWAANAVTDMSEIFKQMQVETIGEPLKCRYVPASETLQKASELGALISAAIKEKL